MSSPATTADLLGPPYTATTLPLRPDAEGEVVATLVQRPAGSPTRKAVLYVHGFCDYFFQNELADFWVEHGYDFFALDLRKCGRSLRPYQTPHHVADLTTYYEELDIAWQQLNADHDDVVINAHSAGGLVAALWLHDRAHTVGAVVLNSPWLAMQGKLIERIAMSTAAEGIGRVKPDWVLPRTVSGYYSQSINVESGGEWSYNLDWKPAASFPVRADWLRAIRTGHARIAEGVTIRSRVLVLTSAESAIPTGAVDPRIHTSDIVLNVEQIRRRSPLLGDHVTIARLKGALHDVILSAPTVRSRAYREMESFLAYSTLD